MESLSEKASEVIAHTDAQSLGVPSSAIVEARRLKSYLSTQRCENRIFTWIRQISYGELLV